MRRKLFSSALLTLLLRLTFLRLKLSYIGGNWEYLKYLALVSVALGIPFVGIKAFRTLRRLKFDVNVLVRLSYY